MTEVICPMCDGRGNDVTVTCRNCGGSGYDPEEGKPFAQCHTCYGEGTEELDICPRCGGDGVIDDDDYLEDDFAEDGYLEDEDDFEADED